MSRVKWLSLVVLLCSVLAFIGYNREALGDGDSLGPVIEMDEDRIYASIKDGEETFLNGMKAVDAKDGDVTDSLVVESISGFTDDKRRYVNYAAFDSDNHVSKISRELVYTDYTPIRFSIEEPLCFPTSYSETDILKNVYAEDCLEGDISDRVSFSTDSQGLDYTPGDYTVVLEVTNSLGDVEKLPVTVSIYESADYNAAPQISLSQYLVYTTVGQSLNPTAYLDSVVYRGTKYGVTEGRGTFGVDTSEWDSDERKEFQEEQKDNPTVSYDKFQITGSVDYQIPGVYELQYSLEDDDSNVGKVNLVIVVEEASK